MSWNLSHATALPADEPSRRLYFFDESLPAGSRNLRHEYGPVTKLGVVFETEEGAMLPNVTGFCGSIVGLDDGSYRLYYTTTGDGAMRIAVAESKDGLSWRRLGLGQETRAGMGDHLLVIQDVPSEPIEMDGDVVATDGRVIRAGGPRNRQDQTGQPQVVRLADGRWRMYYWHHQHGWGRIPYLYTIAESEDGLVWRAPDYGHPALNSHWLGDQSGLDEADRLAEKGRRTNDANFVYYNEKLGCFEQFSQWFLDTPPERRVNEDNCPDFSRMIQRRTSADGRTWSLPELVIVADDRDPWDQQFYHLSVQYHEDWYIGSLGHFRVENEQQTMDLELAFSRDGRRWHRPMRGGFIPRDPGGRDSEGIYPPNTWIDEGETWLCLYTAYARKHNQRPAPGIPKTGIMGARWPKHRMVGLSAGARTGEFTTGIFFPREKEIRLDADIRGWVRAELCDAWGRKLEGYHLADSVPMTGDDTSHVLRWRNADTEGFIHDPVRIRFEFCDATVYSVAF